MKLGKIAEATLTENVHKCSSCILYIVLLSTIFTINVRKCAHFAYSHWYLKKDITRGKFGTRTQWNCIQTTI